MEPIPVEIVNFDTNSESVQNKFCHKISVSKHVYVDKDDVRLKDSPEFYGIAPNKMVRLRFGPLLRILEVV